MRFLLSLMVLTLSSQAFAQGSERGGSDGGGGRGVVCYEGDSITSVELLDLYEGKVLEGYEPLSSELSYEKIYDQVTEKSASKKIKLYMQKGKKVSKGFKLLPAGERLKTINDSGEIFIPRNCQIEQVANFQGPSRIFIVQDFWKKMNETNKAALVMHEYLWSQERARGVRSSARVRRTVARFFAANFSFGTIDHNVKVGDMFCTDAYAIGEHGGLFGSSFSKLSFFISRQEDKSCTFSFENINGSLAFTSTKATSSCDDFFDSRDSGYSSEDNLTLLSAPDQVESHILSLTYSWPMNDRGFREPVRTYRSYNLEFAGFDDDAQSKFDCYMIGERSMQNPWWL